MSKKKPGPKWAMKQAKEKYEAERQRARDRVANKKAMGESNAKD
jgi:hypothetical protein